MVLDIRSVRKTFQDPSGPVDVLRDVSLSLTAGEAVALTGESGSGKSTLMHIAAGLDQADAGQVFVQGTDLTTLPERALADVRRTQIALVFQQFNLIPSLDVAANIRFQAALAGRTDPDYQAHLVSALGLGGQLHKYPENLSGGQQQRVAIARALAAKPALLLADEPTGNLDEATAQAVMDEMLALVAQTDAAFLMVTHSPAMAQRLGRQVHLRSGVVSGS